MENRIEINPKIMAGKPVIKATRIPIYLIVKLVAQGQTFTQILEDYPQLTNDDIKAALDYAGKTLAGEEILPLIKQ